MALITQIANLRFDADFVSIHLRYPVHPRNLRFPSNCSFYRRKRENRTEKDFLSASLPRIPWFGLF
jgi:hypothetical protein